MEIIMEEIKLTREEKRELKKDLYETLNMMSEYHDDLRPKKRDSLDTLVESYCYWADKYNDGYMPEVEDTDNKLSMYLVQEFKKYQ